MLSAAKLTTSNGSIHSYYSADDYYSQSLSPDNKEIIQDQEQNYLSEFNSLEVSDKSNLNKSNRAPSFWYGKLTKDFNLTGEVDKQNMDNLTHGILPNGVEMQGRINENGEKFNDP